MKKTWAKNDNSEKGSGHLGLHILVLLVYRTELEKQKVTFKKITFFKKRSIVIIILIKG